MSTPLRERGRRITQHTAIGNTGGAWLRPMRKHWTDALCRHLENESVVIRVVVADVRGSAPREPGACMLVSPNEIHGTIGGGNLEWQAVAAARALLVAGASVPSVRVRRLVLGRELGQCCGGVVQLWLERFTRSDLPLLQSAVKAISDGEVAVITTELSGYRVTRRLEAPGKTVQEPDTRGGIHFSSTDEDDALLSERIQLDAAPVWLYGAGHVGQALIRVLADLPFEITWIDPRAELLPDKLPDNVHALYTQSPVDEIPGAPADARHLVMTHDHALDYALCHAILARGDFVWLGLIGSKSKGARFRSRLLRDGIAPEAIQRLTCPIGIAGVASKRPAAIAIGVAAQLLQGPGAAPYARPAMPDQQGGDDCSLRACSECSSARGPRA
jgi:xanthine dehydrogenase accessory factor